MKNSFRYHIAVSAAILLFISCSKNTPDIPEDPLKGLYKISEGQVTGASAKAELYSTSSQVYTGYTRFYIALYDSVTGKRLNNAHIQITPLMNMGTMVHSAPSENPQSEEAVNQLFSCSAVFVMPSTGGSWTLTIRVHNHEKGKEGEIIIPLVVSDPPKSKQKSFTAQHNGSKYFISLIEPVVPRIGINDIELAVYKKVSGMSWPADSSLTVLMNPEMPTMGHGSPNNTDPVHTGRGHYRGKVNFTMTGYWKVNLDFMSGAQVADSTQYFDIEF